MARRYVILHHSGHGPEHYDLMLECDEALATWQFPQNPFAAEAPPDFFDQLPCCRLADHRKAYLTYEGPVSGGRGEVRRVASGTCDILEAAADRWVFALSEGGEDGPAGRFELIHETGSAADAWWLRRVE